MAPEKTVYLQEGERMRKDEKLLDGLKRCLQSYDGCHECPYNKDQRGVVLTRDRCVAQLYDDVVETLDEYRAVVDLLLLEGNK